MQEQSDSTVKDKDNQVTIEYDHDAHVVFTKLRYSGRPCISQGLLKDLTEAQKGITENARRGFTEGDKQRLLYQVLCSETPGAFCLGADLEYLIRLIMAKDYDALFRYAQACINILYPASTSYELPFTTIALVQGEALGGGFEAALSCNVLIAEKSATFGFPETVFGLFPGMGAFSYLARKLSPALAKRIIASGKVYTAKELYGLGVVDQLVPDGAGRQAVYDHIQHQRNRHVGFQCLDQIMGQFKPLAYDELMEVTELWVSAALQLTLRNLRLMEYLVTAQRRRWCSNKTKPLHLTTV